MAKKEGILKVFIEGDEDDEEVQIHVENIAKTERGKVFAADFMRTLAIVLMKQYKGHDLEVEELERR